MIVFESEIPSIRPPFYYRNFNHDLPSSEIDHSEAESSETEASKEKKKSLPKRVALVALPFLSLYRPLGFALTAAGNTVRTITSISEFRSALKTNQEDPSRSKKISYATLKLITSASTLILTPIAPTVSMMITTGQDIVMHANRISTVLKEKEKDKYLKVADSCAHIVVSSLYLSIFLSSSLELIVIAFSAQVLLGLYKSADEFQKGNYLEGSGHLVMSALRVQQMMPQIEMLLFKLELQKILADLPVTTDVGKLGKEWEFPSDHIPVGAKVNGTHVGSWNVLNKNFMRWITERDTQGLNGSLISQLDKPSEIMEGLTVREVVIISLILSMMERPDQPFQILALQECRPEFIQGLTQMLPSQIGVICQGPTSTNKCMIDRNIVLFNKNIFTYLENESNPTVIGAYASQPERALMDIVLKNQETGERYQIINAHLPGDPKLPGSHEFAKYVLTHQREDTVTIGLGDMNFNNVEMQEAFDFSAKELGFQNPFQNPINYYTNIGIEPEHKAKTIDHLWIASSDRSEVDIKADLPDEVLPGLQRTVNLLLPRSSGLQALYHGEKIDYEELSKLH